MAELNIDLLGPKLLSHETFLPSSLYLLLMELSINSVND